MVVGEATAADNLPFLTKFFVVADEEEATEAATTEEVVAAATLTVTVGPLAAAVCVCVLTSGRRGLPLRTRYQSQGCHPPQHLRRHIPSRLLTSASPWGDVS